MHEIDYQTPAPSPRRTSRLLYAGIITLILGVGPLLVIIIAAELGLTRDPNPNPIGPGILAGLSLWPGVILTIVGGIRTRKRRSIA